MSYDIKRSVSLYSYQDEYYDGKLDLEGCLRETAKTGATGVELLAEQMIRRFLNRLDFQIHRILRKSFARLSVHRQETTSNMYKNNMI